jgi:hypothetical protein
VIDPENDSEWIILEFAWLLQDFFRSVKILQELVMTNLIIACAGKEIFSIKEIYGAVGASAFRSTVVLVLLVTCQFSSAPTFCRSLSAPTFIQITDSFMHA